MHKRNWSDIIAKQRNSLLMLYVFGLEFWWVFFAALSYARQAGYECLSMYWLVRPRGPHGPCWSIPLPTQGPPACLLTMPPARVVTAPTPHICGYLQPHGWSTHSHKGTLAVFVPLADCSTAGAHSPVRTPCPLPPHSLLHIIDLSSSQERPRSPGKKLVRCSLLSAGPYLRPTNASIPQLLKPPLTSHWQKAGNCFSALATSYYCPLLPLLDLLMYIQHPVLSFTSCCFLPLYFLLIITSNIYFIPPPGPLVHSPAPDPLAAVSCSPCPCWVQRSTLCCPMV